MAGAQKIIGFLNQQQVTENNIVVDKQYLSSLISLPNNPSDTNAVILALFAAMDVEDEQTELPALPPEIHQKIEYNNLVSYREIVESSYCENAFFIDSAYEALDFNTPGRKRLFLRFINGIYVRVVSDYVSKDTSGMTRMEVIRLYADSIFSEVINSLMLRISSNTSSVSHLSAEIIMVKVIDLVSHAFVDCKVLENPNKKSNDLTN